MEKLESTEYCKEGPSKAAEAQYEQLLFVTKRLNKLLNLKKAKLNLMLPFVLGSPSREELDEIGVIAPTQVGEIIILRPVDVLNLVMDDPNYELIAVYDDITLEVNEFRLQPRNLCPAMEEDDDVLELEAEIEEEDDELDACAPTESELEELEAD